MARVRADTNLVVMGVTDLEKADAVLRNIGDLELVVHDAEVRCKRICDKAKAAMQEQAGPAQERIKLNTLALEQFAESHREVFGKAKSIKLQYGQMGWRVSKKTTIGAATASLIKRYFKDRVAELIEVVEKVRVPAVKKLTPAEQIKIEVFTTVSNPFFVESAIHRASDYGTTQDPDA